MNLLKENLIIVIFLIVIYYILGVCTGVANEIGIHYILALIVACPVMLLYSYVFVPHPLIVGKKGRYFSMALVIFFGSIALFALKVIQGF